MRSLPIPSYGIPSRNIDPDPLAVPDEERPAVMGDDAGPVFPQAHDRKGYHVGPGVGLVGEYQRLPLVPRHQGLGTVEEDEVDIEPLPFPVVLEVDLVASPVEGVYRRIVHRGDEYLSFRYGYKMGLQRYLLTLQASNF